MSVLEERDDYLKNPYFQKREYGDFTPFYITITICTILAAVLFIINIVLGCCSRHSEYWNERHTGRFIKEFNFLKHFAVLSLFLLTLCLHLRLHFLQTGLYRFNEFNHCHLYLSKLKNS